MKYPKWLQEMDDHDYEYAANMRPEVTRIIQMAKDAWAMAYLAGTGAEMSPSDFCEKYKDEP